MTTFKKCKVLLLPTNEKAIAKNQFGIVPFGGKNNKDFLGRCNNVEMDNISVERGRVIPQHLYITSDEEIKEGDWCYTGKNEVQQVLEISNKHGHLIFNKETLLFIDCEKIIASTDKSLGLPEPSQGFIEKYVSEYNKGNVIEDVLIEYKYWDHESYGDWFWKPKVSKDNTITIKKVKDSWDREELPVEIIKNMLLYCENQQIYDKLSKYGDFYYKGKKWIEENL